MKRKIKIAVIVLLCLAATVLWICNRSIVQSKNTELTFLVNTEDAFTVTFRLPDKCCLKKDELRGDDEAQAYEYFHAQEKYRIFDEENRNIGIVGYNHYVDYEGEEENPRAIYSEIGLGNDYQFDVREKYREIQKTEGGVTAVTDVIYSASITGEKEKRNIGIVSYDRNRHVYILFEFDSDLVTAEQAETIAKSILFREK